MQSIVKNCALLILVAALCLVACTKHQVVDKEALIVALGSEPATLDPRFATDANGMRIVSLIFNSLIRIGPDLQIEGDAAKNWTFDQKTLSFHFKIYPNLKFSNGRALSASDIEFSFAEYRSDRSPFKSALESIRSVSVSGTNADGFVVTILLSHYSSKFLNSDLPMVRLLPREELLKNPDAFAAKPMGTGYFALVSFESNQIVLRAADQHAIHSPKIKFLVFKIIRDEFTRFQKTLKGSIDIAQAEISPSKVVEFDKRPKEFSVYRYPGLSMTYILVNLRDPVLSKLDVRRAIASSINRSEIIKYKLEGLGREATSILTPTNPYYNPDLKNISFDLASSKKIVENLGLSGKVLTLKTSNAHSAMDNARVLANQISKSGLKVTLQSYEWGTFYSDIRSGNFQLATMRWIGTLDPDIYRMAFHSAEFPPGRNRGRYNNSTLDRLTEEGLTIADENRRVKHYFEVQKIVQDDLAIIPLWYDNQVAVVHKRVHGYKAWSTSDFYPFIFVSKK